MKELIFCLWVALSFFLLLSACEVSCQGTDEEKKEFNATFKDLIVANDLKEE